MIEPGPWVWEFPDPKTPYDRLAVGIDFDNTIIELVSD